MYKSVSRKIFEFFLYLGFIVILLLVLIPFLNVIALSFSSKKAVQECSGWEPNRNAHPSVVRHSSFITLHM